MANLESERTGRITFEEQLWQVLKPADYWYNAYRTASPDIFELFKKMGAEHTAAHQFILQLALTDRQSHHNFGLLSVVTDMLSELERQDIAYHPDLINLLLDSIVLDENGEMLYSEDFPNRLTRTLILFGHGLTEFATRDRAPQTMGGITKFSQAESAYISRHIVAKLRERQGQIGLGSRTSLVRLTFANRRSQMSTEFFRSQKRTEYVRVGSLFFLDASHQDSMPTEIASIAGNNIFYLNLNYSEFADRLGYFTANVLASLLNLDLTGHTILDCGTGSGILALVAKRLGAAAVMGVDLDSVTLARARKNAALTGLGKDESIVFEEHDLSDRQALAEQLLRLADGSPIGILSNIGHWPDYTITNFTPILYLPQLAAAGQPPSFIITGGYSYKMTHRYNGEEIALANHGIDFGGLPDTDKDADAAVLAHFGYRTIIAAESEALAQPGSWPHQAGSLIAFAAR